MDRLKCINTGTRVCMSPSRGSQKGLALVVCLLITAILVTVLTELVYGVYISTSRVTNFKDSQRAAVLASTGVDMANSAIKLLLKQRPYLTMDERGLSFTQAEGEMLISIRAFDERSKLSVNVVYPDTGVFIERIRDSYARLLELLEHGDKAEELVGAIADWIDVDDEPRPFGAEAYDHYRTLKKPYFPKNGLPDTTEELLLVKGYTPKVFRALAPYITVYTDGLVNINTASKVVIMSLSEDISEDLAGRVISYRKQMPFKDRSDVMKVPGFETIGFALQDRITVTSDIYRVFARVTAGEAAREVEAVINTSGEVLYWREM